jgi:hypothetical protein
MSCQIDKRTESASKYRKVQHELDYLIPTIEQAAVMGQMNIEIPRNPERSARAECLAMRAMAVTVEMHRHHPEESCKLDCQVRWLLSS